MSSRACGLILICALGVIAGCGGSATTTTTGATSRSGATAPTGASDEFAISGPQPTSPTRILFVAAMGDRRTYDVSGEVAMSVRDVSGHGPRITKAMLDELRGGMPSVRTTLTGNLVLEVTKIEADQTRVVHMTSTTKAKVSSGISQALAYSYEGDSRYLPSGKVEVGDLTLAGSEGFSQADKDRIQGTLSSMKQTLGEMSRGMLGVSYVPRQRRELVVPKSSVTPAMRVFTTYRGRNAAGDHIFVRTGNPSKDPVNVNQGGVRMTITMEGGGTNSISTWSDEGWMGHLRTQAPLTETVKYFLDANNFATMRYVVSMKLEFTPIG